MAQNVTTIPVQDIADRFVMTVDADGSQAVLCKADGTTITSIDATANIDFSTVVAISIVNDDIMATTRAVDGTTTTASIGTLPQGFDGDFSSLTNTPTTIAGYGITDAEIDGQVVTIGANSVTIPAQVGSGGANLPTTPNVIVATNGEVTTTTLAGWILSGSTAAFLAFSGSSADRADTSVLGMGSMITATNAAGTEFIIVITSVSATLIRGTFVTAPAAAASGVGDISYSSVAPPTALVSSPISIMGDTAIYKGQELRGGLIQLADLSNRRTFSRTQNYTSTAGQLAGTFFGLPAAFTSNNGHLKHSIITINGTTLGLGAIEVTGYNSSTGLVNFQSQLPFLVVGENTLTFQVRESQDPDLELDVGYVQIDIDGDARIGGIIQLEGLSNVDPNGEGLLWNDRGTPVFSGSTSAPRVSTTSTAITIDGVTTNYPAGGGGGGGNLTTLQTNTLTNTPLPHDATISYEALSQIVIGGFVLINPVALSPRAFALEDWVRPSIQTLATISETNDIRPTDQVTVNFASVSATSFGFGSPSTDFKVNPSEYDLTMFGTTTLTTPIAVVSRTSAGLVTIESIIPGLTIGQHTLTFRRRSAETFTTVTSAVTRFDGDIDADGDRFHVPNWATQDPNVQDVLFRDRGVVMYSGERAPYNLTTHFGLTVNGEGTDILNVFVSGTRRRNINTANSAVLFTLEDNFGDRIVAFQRGLIAYEGNDVPVGSTLGSNTGRITLPSTSTDAATIVDRTTLEVQFANTTISMDGKTATIEQATDGTFILAISGIDDTNDLHIPASSGPGIVSFLRSTHDIESLIGPGTVGSSDGTITNDITKGRWDLSVTNPASISGQIITVGDNSLTVPTTTGGTPSEVAVTTYTGIPATGTVDSPAGTRNFIEVTETQLLTIQATPSLIDTTAYYIVIPDPTSAGPLPEPEPQPFAITFTPGFNSPVNVGTTTSDVTITDDTVEIDLVFAVDNPGSTSNNVPTIQIPVVANDGTTIPRPSSIRVALVYELDGIAQALGARATIGTNGAITLSGAFGAATSWNAIGTQTVTINIQYPNN